VLSWLIFFADLALIAWLVLKAYRDADTLDRYVRRSVRFSRENNTDVWHRFEVPFFGRIASRILDDE
jgi:hypothetical protein